MMEERGLSMAHTTIMRWVHQYGPELDKRVRRHLKPTNDSWRVDETYIKVKSKGARVTEREQAAAAACLVIALKNAGLLKEG